MFNGQQRVLVGHPGPRIAHDQPDPFPHFGFVTVDRASGAGGLTFLKGAFFKAGPGVFQELPAIYAQVLTPVVRPAVKVDHH